MSNNLIFHIFPIFMQYSAISVSFSRKCFSQIFSHHLPYGFVRSEPKNLLLSRLLLRKIHRNLPPGRILLILEYLLAPFGASHSCYSAIGNFHPGSLKSTLHLHISFFRQLLWICYQVIHLWRHFEVEEKVRLISPKITAEGYEVFRIAA